MVLTYLTINTTTEIICFSVALTCLSKDNNGVWRSVILFLLLTLITEFTGIYIKKLYLADTIHIRPNVWVYNFFIVFQVGFTSLMFSSLLNKYIKSKPIIIGGLTLLAAFYIYEVFLHGIFEKHNLTTISMSVLFVLYSLYYFYLLLRDEEYIDLKYSYAFWWVTGLLFFYFGRIACVIFNYKLSLIIITPKHYLTYYIYNALNIILYSCWSYSFICRKWRTKISEILSL